jgi:hypothetical protein
MNKQKVKTALKHLYKDIEMLRDGEWEPDEHSCEATLDTIDEIANEINIDIHGT